MKVLLLANTDWFLFNFRLASARKLAELGHSVVMVSPAGPYTKKIEQAGFKWVEWAIDRQGMNPVRELGTIFRLAKIYQREKPDLIHHFTIKCVLYGTLAGQLNGVRAIVNSLTGLGYAFTEKRAFLQNLVSLWYGLSLKKTWTIFENPDDRDEFIRRGWVQSKKSFAILGAGVDTDEFAFIPEPVGVPVVTLPARLLWDKGVGEFVQAAKILHDRGCKVTFRLVGEGDPGNPTSIPEETINIWREEGIVEILGWREDMPAIYAESSVVCLPSYREGLPKTLIEAAAAGRAIVTTDVPGCRHVVSDGENGFLVPVKDASRLAEKIEILTNNPSLRQKMGAQNRKKAEEIFANEKIIQATLAVYARAAKINDGTL